MSQPMSLEAMLDEERREVLELLEGPSRRTASSPTTRRLSSPYGLPRSPIRSMLDIDDVVDPRAPRNTPIVPAQPIRSMLDIDAPPPPASATPLSAAQSPQMTPADGHPLTPVTSRTLHPRSGSDASSTTGTATSPRRGSNERSGRADPTSAYQFSGTAYLPSNAGGPVIPKRNTQGGKKGAMADALRGDLTSPKLDSLGRQALGLPPKSKSPHNRLAHRSQSPHSAMLSINSPPFSLNQAKYTLSDGTPIDINSAYRRLSDANLAMSSGSLAALSSGRRRAFSGGEAEGASRLQKDYLIDENGEAGVESSDDEAAFSSDDDRPRGRHASRKAKQSEHPESQTLGMGRAKGPRQTLSLMAAAEEERQQIIANAAADQYKVRSLLEPQITVTGPSGDRLKPQKAAVHPSTAFDITPSGLNTPVDSGDEAELKDIKRAQKLSVHMTSITSTPETQRCVRTIYRGDFAKMQQEVDDEQRRARKYLVATDLSDEAAHALEWTVGTVLRDGDTLLCIYCADEEVPMLGPDVALKDQAESVAAEVTNTPLLEPLKAAHSGRATPSPAGRDYPKGEQERLKAVEDITERITKLLRRTKLQVRVVIEVIHCKSPKHLITEVIDYLNPTLVILGSRGRSALKGVILGSFSNYLVTKSSVPVMVARKRLRKHSKYKRPTKLANNLNISGKSLATAKID